MFDIIKNGLFINVSRPVFGKQDIGVTPGGVTDQFAYDTGNALLDNPIDAPALEMILAPSLKFREDCLFILTGAKYSHVTIRGGDKKEVEHGIICYAKKDDVLEFGQKEYGLRTYLCYAPASHYPGDLPVGRTPGRFSEVASWPDSDGRIRVIEGPEYAYLDDRDLFLNDYWKVSNDSGSMGMRLENKWSKVTVTMESNMVSEAVSNGTIQLTPDGPIILLKHRQTVGGYPRIFNVISVDVDLLAHYSPGQIIRFKKVTLKEAHEALHKRQNDMMRIKEKYR